MSTIGSLSGNLIISKNFSIIIYESLALLVLQPICSTGSVQACQCNMEYNKCGSPNGTFSFFVCVCVGGGGGEAFFWVTNLTVAFSTILVQYPHNYIFI